MLTHNQTHFVLIGFSCNPKIQIIIFVGVLLIYCLSLLGNLLIICATCLDRKLQIPMYILLSNLAVADFCFMSSSVPKLLASLASHDGSISLSVCLLQFFSYYSFGGTELWSLALLSVDRFLAICCPLRYSTIMTRHMCYRLILGSWIFGFVEFFPGFLAMLQLKFCSKSVFLNHFFCDGSALLNVSCGGSYLSGYIFLSIASFAVLSSLAPTLFSYCCILTSIFRISAASGKRKTFSTCSSHLLVVSITYGSCIFIYIRPAGSMSTSLEKTVAVFNSIFIPLLNPFIYTLRNQKIKKTLKAFWATK
uniref:Olfactory receptor n=1 Tax=Leptobrachium leishanense TaxID=445787 RepID=A0A8C5M6G9_9ANUR